MYRVCCVKCWFVDDLFIIIKLHPSPFLMHDGHDSEDTKQSTADMTAFVSPKSPAADGGLFNSHFFRSWNHTFNWNSNHSISYQQFVFVYIGLNRNFFDFDDLLDDMGGRINELEQSINDLRAEMGVEGTPPPASKSGDEPKTPAS
ncbi:hypothetical protein HID58_012167 [Brassica napus]|uniref:Heat shock factor binding protein n=1 Tax=Brassica napus TaxID=3708 RepID=A0ABQ8E2V2_BRANA|nr:hypothetical protein HID58_012167 [Brassica napus]